MTNLFLVDEFKMDKFEVTGLLYKGKPHFIAYEVSELLGYTDIHKAIRKFCQQKVVLKYDEVVNAVLAEANNLKHLTEHNGITLIPESDLFALIMRSKLKAAVKFQRWVCEEVLPSIRRTGSYSYNTQSTVDSIITSLAGLGEQEVNELNTKLRELGLFVVTPIQTLNTIKSRIATKINQYKINGRSLSITAVSNILLTDFNEIRGLLISSELIVKTPRGYIATHKGLKHGITNGYIYTDSGTVVFPKINYNLFTKMVDYISTNRKHLVEHLILEAYNEATTVANWVA